jgi:uncharacterized protein with ParB-like and HNH nuclease domain
MPRPLLELYHDYVAGLLSKADFVRSVRLVEAYVFRRAICAIPTNSMNKNFATFTNDERAWWPTVRCPFTAAAGRWF